MILCTGDEIRLTDPHRHKYLSAMAEYLDHLAGMSGEDASSGDVECSTGWFALFGRRILVHNSQGFVWTETFDTATEARAHYDLLDTEYGMWGNDEEEDE